MNYLDLFSGIGGFSKGLLNAGFKFDWHGYSEIDAYAESIYQKQFPDAHKIGDISNVNTKALPKIELITLGWPCQDVSIAGRRGGLQAARSGLFFEAIRILRVVRPTYFIAENVKGLFSSNNGADFTIVLQEITNIGYDCQWQLLNTRWVLPQNRERIYFVGHLRERSRPKVFPLTESTFWTSRSQEAAQRSGTRIRSENSENIASSILKRYGGDGCDTIIDIGTACDGYGASGRIQDQEGACSTLLKAMGTGGNNIPLIQKEQIRRLTPLECERLQGFPEIENLLLFNINKDTICLDLQKSYVNVEMKNHRWQKSVGSVEKEHEKEIALYVELNSNIKNQQIEKLVQPSVHINCAENEVRIRNQEKSQSFVNYVGKQNLFHQLIKKDDFVQLVVGLNTTLKSIIIGGKAGLLRNEQHLIQVKNGKLFVKQFGKEITQLVKNAKIDLTTLKEHLKYITLHPLSLKSIDLNWIISFYYVMIAIIGFIQKEIRNNNLLISLYSRQGWTYGLSDTRRYQCLGNAVSVPIVAAVAKKLKENING